MSTKLTLLAVLIRCLFGSTFTGQPILFAVCFFRKMDKKIYKLHNPKTHSIHPSDFLAPFSQYLGCTISFSRGFSSDVSIQRLIITHQQLVD
jgi:hypothetical protein